MLEKAPRCSPGPSTPGSSARPAPTPCAATPCSAAVGSCGTCGRRGRGLGEARRGVGLPQRTRASTGCGLTQQRRSLAQRPGGCPCPAPSACHQCHPNTGVTPALLQRAGGAPGFWLHVTGRGTVSGHPPAPPEATDSCAKVNTAPGWVNTSGGGRGSPRLCAGPPRTPKPLQSPPAPARPHSRQDSGALELPPGAGLVVWLDEALDAILHHTAHAARHHVGTPVPAGGKGSGHTPGMRRHAASPRHAAGVVLVRTQHGTGWASSGLHLGAHRLLSWHLGGIIPAQSSHSTALART